MNVLVTGGAGYIGSHAVKDLVNAGYKVVVYDNLGKGHERAVAQAELIVGDLSDREKLIKVFRDGKIEAVMHFAADSLVGESMVDPDKYYRNNIANGIALLSAMVSGGVKKLIFSSTAAVYGEPSVVPITEDCPTTPTNVYGHTKLIFEDILKDYDRAYGLRYMALRYFNASGADASGALGEDHCPETHLIPIVLQVALGQREKLQIFGDDYPTEDGTCIRDYIHVNDLARAHRLALQALQQGAKSNTYNLGSGTGFSVYEIIRTAELVTGRTIPYEVAPRRPGDPAVLLASSQKIRTELGWLPELDNMGEIIASAWRWHLHHPKGFTKA